MKTKRTPNKANLSKKGITALTAYFSMFPEKVNINEEKSNWIEFDSLADYNQTAFGLSFPNLTRLSIYRVIIPIPKTTGFLVLRW